MMSTLTNGRCTVLRWSNSLGGHAEMSWHNLTTLEGQFEDSDPTWLMPGDVAVSVLSRLVYF